MNKVEKDAFNALFMQDDLSSCACKRCGKVTAYMLSNQDFEWRDSVLKIWSLRFMLSSVFLWRGLEIDLFKISRKKVTLLKDHAQFYFDCMAFPSDFFLVDLGEGKQVLCEKPKYMTESSFTLGGKPVDPIIAFVTA